MGSGSQLGAGDEQERAQARKNTDLGPNPSCNSSIAGEREEKRGEIRQTFSHSTAPPSFAKDPGATSCHQILCSLSLAHQDSRVVFLLQYFCNKLPGDVFASRHQWRALIPLSLSRRIRRPPLCGLC